MCNSETGLIEIRQDGIMDRDIEALGLENGAEKVKCTPAEANPLLKDKYGLQVSVKFSYSRFIGMLMELAGHIIPGIAYAVNYSTKYMFGSRHYHEFVLNIVDSYLKATRDK